MFLKRISAVFIMCLATAIISCAPVSNGKVERHTGIEGSVFNDKQEFIEGAYIYLYRSLSSKLIGPADFMTKTDGKGLFFLEAPEGRYYLVARKRLKGGDAGPLKEGDRVVVYPKNPVVVSPGKATYVEVILPEKALYLQKRMPVGDINITLIIKNIAGKTMKILIYQGDDPRKSPEYVVEGGEGETNFSLDRGKNYIIVVREEMKEKIREGELFGTYGPFVPEALKGSIEITPEPHR